MDDESINKFDQGSAFIGDNLPPLWRRLFLNCVGQGFTEDQAMSLVRTYIHASSGGRMEK